MLDTDKNPGDATSGVFYAVFYGGLSHRLVTCLFYRCPAISDEMANHTRHDSDNKRYEEFHVAHPLSVTRFGEVTKKLYHRLSECSISFSKVQKIPRVEISLPFSFIQATIR